MSCKSMKILVRESSQSNHVSPEPPYLHTQGPLVERDEWLCEKEWDANILWNVKNKYGIL